MVGKKTSLILKAPNKGDVIFNCACGFFIITFNSSAFKTTVLK